MTIKSFTDLRSDDYIDSQAVCLLAQIQSLSEKVTKTNKPYLEIQLVDAKDNVVWRLWEDHPQFLDRTTLRTSSCIALEGRLSIGEYGLDGTAEVRAQSEAEKKAFFQGDAGLTAQQNKDYQDIVNFITSINDLRFRSLGELFLKKFGAKFRRTAAARKNHHARCGGLVEHVAQMMRSANALCQVYQTWNRDLLLAGVLFHDCGKLWENAYGEESFVQQTSLMAELTSHIPLGMEVVNRLWTEIIAKPELNNTSLQPDAQTCRLHLLHLIASHHGQYDFGSPVLPKTPEAFALHFIDNIDARYEMCQMSYENSEQIQDGIYERMFPLGTGLIAPLKTFKK